MYTHIILNTAGHNAEGQQQKLSDSNYIIKITCALTLHLHITQRCPPPLAESNKPCSGGRRKAFWEHYPPQILE